MMKDLAYTAEEIKAHKTGSIYAESPSGKYEGPKYPYGLDIRLENDTLKKAGKTAADFKIGEEMTVSVKVRVTSISSNETERGGKNECVCLTVTAIDMGGGSDDAGTAKVLYGSK